MEQRYSTFDRELLAAVAALRHFRYMVEGRAFTLLTDHKPLTHALHRSSDSWSARQQRHLAYLSEFTADIQHIPGKENVVANSLSRPAAALTPASQAGALDWQRLATEQKDDPEINDLEGLSSLKLQLIEVGGARMLCDRSTGTWRPLLTVSFRQTAFHQLHQLAHAGV